MNIEASLFEAGRESVCFIALVNEIHYCTCKVERVYASYCFGSGKCQAYSFSDHSYSNERVEKKRIYSMLQRWPSTLWPIHPTLEYYHTWPVQPCLAVPFIGPALQ